MTEDGPDQSASAGSNGSSEDMAFNVILGFDYLTLIDLNVLSRLPCSLSRCRALYAQNGHLCREFATIDFKVAKRKVHGGLATEQREMLGMNDSADRALYACSRR